MMAQVAENLDLLAEALDRRDAAALSASLENLERIGGRFPFDYISSLAWATRAICATPLAAGRPLNEIEAHSVASALGRMDRARRAALTAAAA